MGHSDKIRMAGLLSALLFTACSTVSDIKPVYSQKESPHKVTQAAPDMRAVETICDQLKAQFQTQLPMPILNLMHWQVGMSQNPLVNEPAALPSCQMHLTTDGATIKKLGLTPQFMTAVLERLDWAQNTATNAYAAGGPTGERLLMMQGKQRAIINYEYAPPAGACPNNQPIAACTLSQKKWVYQLTLLVLAE